MIAIRPFLGKPEVFSLTLIRTLVIPIPPEEGESVVCDGIRLVVDRLDKNRIDRVKIILPKEEKEEEPA